MWKIMTLDDGRQKREQKRETNMKTEKNLNETKWKLERESVLVKVSAADWVKWVRRNAGKTKSNRWNREWGNGGRRREGEGKTISQTN